MSFPLLICRRTLPLYAVLVLIAMGASHARASIVLPDSTYDVVEALASADRSASGSSNAPVEPSKERQQTPDEPSPLGLPGESRSSDGPNSGTSSSPSVGAGGAANPAFAAVVRPAPQDEPTGWLQREGGVILPTPSGAKLLRPPRNA